MTGTLALMGMPPALKIALGGDTATGLSGAGTSSQSAATPIANGLNVFSTVASNSGAVLPKASEGSWVIIVNGGANPLLVYPATGEKINNGTATTGSFSVTNAKNAIFIASNGQWGAVLGA